MHNVFIVFLGVLAMDRSVVRVVGWSLFGVLCTAASWLFISGASSLSKQFTVDWWLHTIVPFVFFFLAGVFAYVLSYRIIRDHLSGYVRVGFFVWVGLCFFVHLIPLLGVVLYLLSLILHLIA